MNTATPAAAVPALNTPGYFTSGSDRYPCTVTAVSKSGHTVTVRREEYRVVSGSAHDGSAKYEFTPGTGPGSEVFTRRQDGTYRRKGNSYSVLVLGAWDAYYDPHF